MEKCRRMNRPQFMSKNWIYSWLWKSSNTRQQYCRSEIFAMKTDILMNGSMVENHISLKMVFGYNATRRTSFLSWFKACQRVLPPVLIIQLQWHLHDRRGIVPHLLQSRLLHQRQQHQVIVRLEKEWTEKKMIPLPYLYQVSMLMIERGHPLFADSDRASSEIRSDGRIEGNFGGWWSSWTQSIDMQSWYLATQWIQAYPCKTKTSQETQRSLQKFLEPTRNPKVIYTDNSMEFGKACEDLSWNHCTSTPHGSETNGIAERAVRRVKEGTFAVLLQSGLNENWWADSMECYVYLRNVTDLLSDGKTPYERRFGQPFRGPILPFGSLVEYYTISAKDQSRIHQFGKKVLPGLFLGYALYAGRIWKGDVLIADLEELETMDASEIYSKRLNAKEVIFPKEKGEFIFPIADGRIKLPGGDQDLRTSTLIREHPIRGESHVDFLGESEGSLPPPHDSFPDAGEEINEFWSMSANFIYRHHVEPRVKLYSPREELFPILLKYIDVFRTTHTNVDVKQEKRIDDYRNIDGSSRPVRSLDRFHTIYFIGRKNLLMDICGPVRD